MSSDFLSDLDKWVTESITKSAEEAATSHPSANVEDGNKPATEGARSSENEADVKADIPGDNVNVAKGSDAEGAGRGENAPVLEMANAKATGEDPANETSSVKDKPEDPGTAHPAKATMGEKYSAAQLMNMGDDILRDIAAAEPTVKKAEAHEAVCDAECKKDEAGKKAEEPKKEESKEDEASEEEMKEAEAAGRAAAASIIEAIQEKQASANPVDQAAVIDSIVKNASADAQNVIEYLAMFKQAMGEMAPEEMAALADAAAGGGIPAEAAPADAAIEEAVGAAPEEAAMAEAGAGDAEVDALVDALVEAGVEPEELLALAGEGEAAPVEEAAAPVEDVVEEAEITEEPKEAARKKAALKDTLKKIAAKTA